VPSERAKSVFPIGGEVARIFFRKLVRGSEGKTSMLVQEVDNKDRVPMIGQTRLPAHGVVLIVVNFTTADSDKMRVLHCVEQTGGVRAGGNVPQRVSHRIRPISLWFAYGLSRLACPPW
jgi:hypothetical protein